MRLVLRDARHLARRGALTLTVASRLASGAIATLALSGLLWVTALGSTAPAGEAPMAAHRAIYGMLLSKSKPGGSAIADAKGKLEFEWSDVCDGWAVRQRARIFVTHGDGSEVDFGWTLNTWESKDGLSYRFFIRRLHAAGDEEILRGEAQLDGPGAAGQANYTEPEAKRIDLPKGTIFPTQHSFQIIEAAAGDMLPLWRTVFDGSGDDDGLFGVNVVRTASVAPDVPPSLDAPLLKAATSWRAIIAYFGMEESATEPEYEELARVYDNGVVDELLLDYGDFSLDAVLADLKALPDPNC